MKIKLSIACIALALAVNSEAQQIKAGLNFANVSVNESGRIDDANMLTSFHAGFTGNIKLGTSLLSLQPGILLTGKGSKLQKGEPGQNGYYRQSSNPLYVELPVNMVVKAPVGTSLKLFAGAGPYLAVGIAGKNKTEGQNLLGTYDTERDIRFSDDDPTTLNEEEGTGFGVLKRFDYGLNAIGGLEANNVVLYVNYGYGLAKLQSGGNSSADNNNKHRVLGLGLGFKF